MKGRKDVEERGIRDLLGGAELLQLGQRGGDEGHPVMAGQAAQPAIELHVKAGIEGDEVKLVKDDDEVDIRFVELFHQLHKIVIYGLEIKADLAVKTAPYSFIKGVDKVLHGGAAHALNVYVDKDIAVDIAQKLPAQPQRAQLIDQRRFAYPPLAI